MTKLVGLIKGIAAAVDAVTLPIHYAINRSAVRAQKATIVRAKQLNPSDPYSPWVRTSDEPPTTCDDCETVDQLMRKVIRVHGDKPCIATRAVLGIDKDGRKNLANQLDYMTFNELDREIDNLVVAFRELGIKRGDRVAIFMETRYEWMAAGQAILRMGANMATLYATLGDDGVIHGLNELEAQTVITSNSLLEKLKNILPKCPKLKNVILVRDQTAGQYTPVPRELGKNVHLSIYDHLRQSATKPEAGSDNQPQPSLNNPSDIALIIYTSGSTGIPKGVQLSHANIIACMKAIQGLTRQIDYTDQATYIAFLPLAHVLEFGSEMVTWSLGFKVGYASPTTLTDGAIGLTKASKGDFSVIQPESVAAVPLVVDKMRKGIEQQIRTRAGEKGLRILSHFVEYKCKWNMRGYQTPLVDALVFKKFRAILGGKVRLMMCGGAPLSPDTQRFARSLFNLHLSQGWASTEMTGIGTVTDFGDLKLGKCGAPLPNTYIKLRDWPEGGYLATDKPNPRGELVVGGPHVTMGYFKREDETQESFYEEDGRRWFISGDIGEIFPDGTVKIIDRRKDLVKLQNGKFISLGKIESELKGSPLVENICIIADPNYKFCIALITPNAFFLNKLIKRHNLINEDKFNSEKIDKLVSEEIAKYAKKKQLQKAEIPERIKLCKEEWTPSNNLVTAAFKVRRKQIRDFYEDDIRKLYAE